MTNADVAKYENMIKGILLKFGIEPRRDPDMLQVAFCGLTRAFNTYDPKRSGKMSTHIFWVVRSEIVDELRKRKRLSRTQVVEWLDRRPCRRDYFGGVEYEDGVDHLLRRLTPSKAKVMRLCSEGYTITEIGQHCGFTRQRAHDLHRRALDDLRRIHAPGMEAVA